jgi:serine protease Do
MSRFLALAVCAAAFAASVSAQQPTREEKVRNDKKKVEAEGKWIYNDAPKAFAEAKTSGKPIVAVLRCLPCEECVKLDDDLIDADERIKPLLEKFVPLRIVSTNGLDLSIFQFDTDQSFAIFFLRDDGTVYGRFGTRSHRKNWIGDVSVDGLAAAMAGALALHEDFPKVKESLAGKRGPAPEFASPELFPSLKARYKPTIDYKGNVVASCIHCHQIGDAVRDAAFAKKEPLPDSLLFPYPHPKSLGLILDPKTRAAVLSVAKGSDAEKAGFQTGDAIRTLDGQPVLSIADVQWVLHNTPATGGTLKAEITRGKAPPMELSLKLAKGWRQRDDISWRASTWGLRRKALGGFFPVDLPAEERTKAKLAPAKMAFLIQHVGLYPPHDVANKAGIRKGDILVGFDGRTDILRETDLIAYALREKKAGDEVKLELLRDGKPVTISMKLPQ